LPAAVRSRGLRRSAARARAREPPVLGRARRPSAPAQPSGVRCGITPLHGLQQRARVHGLQTGLGLLRGRLTEVGLDPGAELDLIVG